MESTIFAWGFCYSVYVRVRTHCNKFRLKNSPRVLEEAAQAQEAESEAARERVRMSSPAPALGAWPPQPSDELWRIAGGQPDFDANGELCVIADRLYLASLASRPAPRPEAMFLTLSKKMQYAPFCADFGPVNLGSHFAQACARCGPFQTHGTASGTRLPREAMM